MELEKAMEIIVAQAERIYDFEKEKKENDLWFRYYTRQKKENGELKKELERVKDSITEDVSHKAEPILIEEAA